MSFATAINCMDGRVQEQTITFLKKHFNVKYVDMITEPGPVRDLSGDGDEKITESILRRAKISIEAHNSVGIAVIAHYDCAGNPVDDRTQKSQIAKSVEILKKQFPGHEVIALWIGSDWTVGLLNV